MAYDPSIFNINPYYDDYDPAKAFLRVLFKPGYAVQARELTQIQSILQDQISQVGDHLFKDGSRIVGGGISVRNTNYLMIQPDVQGLTDISDYSFVLNATVKFDQGASAAQPEARVVHYIEPDSTDGNLVLILDYISGSQFNTGSTVLLTTDTDSPDEYTLQPAQTSWAAGSCKLVSVDDGIFYIDGFFARNQQQYYVPYRTIGTTRRDFEFGTAYSSLNSKVGFSITRDSITESQDSSLRDPAIGSYNYNAPGADRFKIDLVLDQKDLLSVPDNFVELLRFENGKITRKVERVTYGEIEKTLSRRTYDESGSYIVKPFEVNVALVGATLQYTIGKGKAYVQGYELDSQYPQTVEAPAARTTQTESTLVFPFSSGNWVGACAGFDTDTIASFGTTFNTFIGTTLNNGSAEVYFRNSSKAVIGQAKLHGLIPFGFVSSASGLTRGHYKMYLYGVSADSSISTATSAVVMPAGKSVSSGQTLAVFGACGAGGVFTNINGSDSTSLVYDVKPAYAVSNFTGVEFYTEVISNSVGVCFSGSAAGTPTIYGVSLASHFSQSIPAAAGTDMLSFFPYTPTGTNNPSDVRQVTILSGDGLTGTTAQAYSPGHSTNMTGVTLASDEFSYLRLLIPGNAQPIGFTAGNVRLVVPLKYSLNASRLAASAVSSYARTKTSTTHTTSAITPNTNGNPKVRGGRKYIQLPHYDVYSIVGITMSGTDVTSWFELDDGQREDYYDFSRLYVKAEKSSSLTADCTVTYKYFAHGGQTFAPFVGANSYFETGTTPLNYSHIPLYTNTKTGRTISLANAIDFRHSGPNNPSPLSKPYGSYEFPSALANTRVSYNHYLPRIDKIKLKVNPSNGAPLFVVEQGQPDLVPVAPPDTDDAITLYTALVPAYTHKSSDIMLTPHDNRRYTMADVGNIEKRVNDVETFATLSASETELETKSTIAYARLLGSSTTLEPIKTSLYVDEFTGHNSGDVASDEHICSVDYEYGELRPFFLSYPISLGNTSGNSSVVASSDGVWTLSYGVTAHTQNLGYTKTLKPNPTNTTNWLGFLTASKTIETTWDTSYRPLTKTNALGENDNWISSDAYDRRGFGTQWNDWESMWTGIETRQEENDTIQRAILELPRSASPSAVASVDSGNPSIGVGRRIDATTTEKLMGYAKSKRLKNRIKETVEGRVVDKSVLPYISNQTIGLTAYGLKPNATNLSVFFDGISLAGGGNGLSADKHGTVSVSFTIPANRFTVGEKLIRISDSFDPQNASTAAETVFYAVGALAKRDSGSYSTRPPELRRQSVTSEGIIKTPFNRDVSYDSNPDTVENNQWTDPLCQTFIVDKKTYPNGMFVSSVDVFFAKKDTLLPVTVQLRPTVNGYPSPSVVLPFSTVTKLPSGVTVDANNGNPVATGFTFSSPVYLEPGEYAIAVVTNSGKYELYASDTSLNTTSGGRAGNNASVGTLYVPQNTSTWVADNATDIAFRVNRCVFNNTASGTIDYSTDGAWTSRNNQIVKITNNEIVPIGCSVSRTVGNVPFKNGQNTYFATTKTGSNTLPISYTLTRGTSDAVSPVIDMGTFTGNAVSMYLSTTSPSGSNGYPTSSYVTRAVVLPQDSTANGILVYTNAVVPQGATLNLYCKYSSSGESGLYQSQWRQMTRVNPAFTSSTESDFREAIYGITSATVSPLNGLGGAINSYQIKAEFLANGTSSYSKTPALKNISVVTWAGWG
jgi:hypothetical protein